MGCVKDYGEAGLGRGRGLGGKHGWDRAEKDGEDKSKNKRRRRSFDCGRRTKVRRPSLRMTRSWENGCPRVKADG